MVAFQGRNNLETVMEPINYVEALDNHYGGMGFPPYQWTINDGSPLHRPAPLSQCRVAILVSGGISACSMPGFDPMAWNDHRVDAISSDADAAGFQIHDAYYDHSDADTDINCVFPIERLREMDVRGEVGSIAARHWSGFMGRIYNRTKVMEESAPTFVEKLREDGVEVLLAVPA